MAFLFSARPVVRFSLERIGPSLLHTFSRAECELRAVLQDCSSTLAFLHAVGDTP
jgi:hypothetical protein